MIFVTISGFITMIRMHRKPLLEAPFSQNIAAHCKYLKKVFFDITFYVFLCILIMIIKPELVKQINTL